LEWPWYRTNSNLSCDSGIRIWVENRKFKKCSPLLFQITFPATIKLSDSGVSLQIGFPCLGTRTHNFSWRGEISKKALYAFRLEFWKYFYFGPLGLWKPNGGNLLKAYCRKRGIYFFWFSPLFMTRIWENHRPLTGRRDRF